MVTNLACPISTEVPNLGYMYPGGTFSYVNGTFKVRKYKVKIYLYYLYANIYTYISEYHFKTQFVLTVKYIYYFKGACSSVQMLKGYIVRQRLGTP